MMKNYGKSVEINEPYVNGPYILDHLNKILVIGNSGSSRTNALNKLMNLINFSNKILTKFIYMSKIYSNRRINCLSTEAE